MTTVVTATTRREKLKTVMLIDDNEIDNFINRKILENCGLTDVLAFTDTTTALQHLTQTADIPQLVLLDIYFPIMNGFEFLDKFNKLEIARQPIDIIFLTCSMNPADKWKARQKNCVLIEKPLTAENLFAQLDTLDKKGKPQQLTEI